MSSKYVIFKDPKNAERFMEAIAGDGAFNVYANRVQGQIEVHLDDSDLDRSSLRELTTRYGGRIHKSLPNTRAKGQQKSQVRADRVREGDTVNGKTVYDVETLQMGRVKIRFTDGTSVTRAGNESVTVSGKKAMPNTRTKSFDFWLNNVREALLGFGIPVAIALTADIVHELRKRWGKGESPKQAAHAVAEHAGKSLPDFADGEEDGKALVKAMGRVSPARIAACAKSLAHAAGYTGASREAYLKGFHTAARRKAYSTPEEFKSQFLKELSSSGGFTRYDSYLINMNIPACRQGLSELLQQGKVKKQLVQMSGNGNPKIEAYVLSSGVKDPNWKIVGTW